LKVIFVHESALFLAFVFASGSLVTNFWLPVK
jgi:hypothetical protein